MQRVSVNTSKCETNGITQVFTGTKGQPVRSLYGDAFGSGGAYQASSLHGDALGYGEAYEKPLFPKHIGSLAWITCEMSRKGRRMAIDCFTT